MSNHDFDSWRRLTARKAHGCAECSNRIEKGDSYTRYSTRHGRYITRKLCDSCRDKIEAQLQANPGHRVPFGSLYPRAAT